VPNRDNNSKTSRGGDNGGRRHRPRHGTCMRLPLVFPGCGAPERTPAVARRYRSSGVSIRRPVPGPEKIPVRRARSMSSSATRSLTARGHNACYTRAENGLADIEGTLSLGHDWARLDLIIIWGAACHGSSRAEGVGYRALTARSQHDHAGDRPPSQFIVTITTD
jgi:hypothetical protein